MNEYRTHNCNELKTIDINKTVKLSGWVYRKRDHGKIIFIDLRDHYGITQLVFSEENKSLFETINKIHLESVITITGKVSSRSSETINSNLKTGEIEVLVENIIIISESDLLPMSISGTQDYPEETRLKYRFLDLRREKVKNHIILRSKIISELRKIMESREFIEIQTPILTASSPEGARDYLVPSRIHPGKFYALPQAPQQFKQLLMIGGFDKYFQIAPCFRDEDARADRSPGEFYQLDIEMSFINEQDIFKLIEPVLYEIFTKFSDKKVDPDFLQLTYKEAMLKYGSDKPDLRNPILITDMTEVFRNSDFNIFRENINSGMVVRAIPAPSTFMKARSFFDEKIEYAKKFGAKGLGYITFDNNFNAKGPIAKFLDQNRINKILELGNIKPGDSIFFASEEEDLACKIASEIRKLIGIELELVKNDIFKFCWITDFPYFAYNDLEKKIDFFHNPFSMPKGGLEALNTENPLNITSNQYDIVCNGIELSSGAIRNNSLDIMYKAFSIAGYSANDVDKQFGALVRAFKFGVPPHGGIAPGIDRMVMLIAEELNIREVICFPLNQRGEDSLMQAPSYVDDKKLLKELFLKTTVKK